MRKSLKIENFFEADKVQERESPLTLFDKYLFRPLGAVFALILYKYFLLTPNKITLLSVIFTFLGGLFLINNQEGLAIFFFLLFPVLDCADGTLARVLKSENGFGTLVDAMGGYSFIVIFWFSLSIFEGANNSFFGQNLCIIILSINLWCRLYLNKKAAISEIDNSGISQDMPRSSKLYNIYENFEFGSAQIPILAFSFAFNLLPVFIYFYFIVSLGLLFWTIKSLFRNAS